MLDFVGLKLSPEDLMFSIGQPLLEHLVPTELVAPDGGGDVTPEGLVVDVDIEGSVTKSWSIYEVSDYLGCGSYGSRVIPEVECTS